MLNFLIKIRNKSNDEKKVVLIISTIFTLIIISGVWYFLSGINLRPIQYVASENEKVSGLSAIVNVFEGSFKNMTENFLK